MPDDDAPIGEPTQVSQPVIDETNRSNGFILREASGFMLREDGTSMFKREGQ